jgi:hypothetical protein
MATISEAKLIEKIVRAKVKIEAIPHRTHATTCPVEDPTSIAPCTCGASNYNNSLDSALRELKLEG